MSLDYATLDTVRQNHPAWRLLNSPLASLIASFLHRAFVAPNQRLIPQADLTEAQEDELFGLREWLGGDSFKTVVDEQAEDVIVWKAKADDGPELSKLVGLPRVIFVR